MVTAGVGGKESVGSKGWGRWVGVEEEESIEG